MKKCLEIKDELHEGVVIERARRFTVRVLEGSRIRLCHLHDTGRLEELIFRNNTVLFVNKKGKATDCMIIAAKAHDTWVITNSLLHRDLALCVFPSKLKPVPEVKLYESRIDFFIPPDLYVETKGCTLIKRGVAIFPDAPTERGKKHLLTLMKAVESGYKAEIMFLVMSEKAKCFYPNYRTDPEFNELFFKAIRMGVKAIVPVFSLKGKAIYFLKEISVCKDQPLI